MTSLLCLIGIILGISVLAYNRAAILVWSIAGFVGLLLISLFSPWHGITLILLWIIYLALVIPLNKSPLRLNYLSRPLLRIFRKNMPKMSETEREALEAGTVHWSGELFGGAPDWHAMLEHPQASVSAEEQAFLDGPVEELCRMIDDWDITHNRADLPPEIWSFLKTRGFFSLIIPKEYGGLDFSATAHSRIITKVAGFSVSVATTIAVPNSLGPAELILKYGTEEQKTYYLPRLTKGEEIPCFALTGPEAGSDATSIPDTGIVCKGNFQGKTITGIKLNFDKRYITLAPVATVIGLAFKLYDPEHLLGDKENIGISCALLPRDTPGIHIGRRHFPLNSVFQNGPIQGENVFIPLDWIIGGAKMAGRGWRMLVECLSVGRGISLPSMACGGAKLSVAATGAYARIRQQFGMPIGRFEGVEEALARIAGNAYVMDAAREMTVAAIDRGEKPAVLTAIVKYHLTERARQVANDVLDIHGGKGICLGPRNYIGRGYQSIPISITVEGANILTRSMIIFGQGAIRCHTYVLQEMHAALDTDQERGLKNFDEAIFAHLGLIFSNFVRSLSLALTSSRVVLAPHGDYRRYFQHFTRFSSAFSFLADMVMGLMGGDLKRKEKISARLGDILSMLYLGSAVLKRFHDEGQPKEDIPLLDWACQDLLYKIQQTLEEIVRNLPNRAVAALARWVMFPLGTRFRPPSDKLTGKVARLLLEPNPARDRLVQGACLATDAINPVGRMEVTLTKVIAAEPLEKKIRQAQKEGVIHGFNFYDLAEKAREKNIINAEEYEQLLDMHKDRMDVIHVDDFAPEDLARTARRKKEKTPLRAAGEAAGNQE